MSLGRFALFLAMPLFTLVAYLLARGLLPEGSQKYIYAENGPIELGTAICFAIASMSAFALSRRRHGLPTFYAILFLLFGAGCAFVTLEEISYGQQFFGWKSPEWFQANNHHHQTNLHNLMGNRPSHILKHVATYGTLLGFIVVPAIALCFKRTYQARHWTYYLLPRMELVVTTALAQLCSFLWDSPKPMLGDYWHQGWNEVRELYWGMAALSYIVVIRQRLLSASSDRQVVRAFEPRGLSAETKNAA